ncbi:MAG: hypothetical protein QXX04_00500 [Candidatus Aenigmatarchaeota archaeon]
MKLQNVLIWKNIKTIYFINESNKTINVYVYISVNYCTDEIKVKVEKDGVICRCLCKKIVKIYNANISKKIRFVDYNKNEINNGCSREICRNLSEEIFLCVFGSCAMKI